MRVDSGSVPPISRRESWYDKEQQHENAERRHDRHQRRIEQRRGKLCAQRFFLLQIAGECIERFVERPRRFAGTNDTRVQRIEKRRLQAHRFGQRRTALHRASDRLRRFSNLRLRTLTMRHRQRAIERRAGVKQRRDGARPERYGTTPRCRTAKGARGGWRGRGNRIDRHGPQLLLSQLAKRRVARRRAHNALDHRAGVGRCAVAERGAFVGAYSA